MFLAIFLTAIFGASFVYAQKFSSDDFRVLDPVILPAGYSTSTGFQLIGTISQISIGTSSATGFKVNSGFLYFPFVTKPSATATAGDGQVSLSWTASEGFLGWNVSGYNVGQSAVSGGPYTFTSVGNVLSSTLSGLSNGTTYYFIVRPEDAFGNSIATSTEVSATPLAGLAVPTPGEGQGGPLIPIFFPPLPLVFVPLPEACPIGFKIMDLDCDGRVGLRDLSIFLFLTPRPLPNRADFNSDKKVDVKDLSTLFFGWTEKLLTFIPDEGEAPAGGFKGGITTQERFAAVSAPEEEKAAPTAPQITREPFFVKVNRFISGVVAKTAIFAKTIWGQITR